MSGFAARGVAALMALLLVAASVVALQGSTANAAEGEVQVTATSSSPVLAGEPGSLQVSAHNPGPAPWYNLGFSITVPKGITYAPGGTVLTAPRVVSGPNVALGLGAGQDLWIWEDVVDLPVGASHGGTVNFTIAQPAADDSGTVSTPQVDVFPAGSEFIIDVTAHASIDARLLPVFPGSTGVSTPDAVAATVQGSLAQPETTVTSLRVTKSEPSPESELLRGVHDNVTTYSITVQNTTQGTTGDIVLVDYLHAGLEFLGDGSDDNSSAPEYPGAPDLGGTSPAGYVTPFSVTTVEKTGPSAEFPADLPNGVYTRVEWRLPDLAPGASRTIEYLAGIPLFENTLWGAGEPSGEGLGQIANLDNNTGASTRHSADDAEHTIANHYQNLAEASGQYRGVVRQGADRAVSDFDTETVEAVDVHVIKSVNDTEFLTNGTVVYTLQLRASEYTSASDIRLVDIVDDAVCPILPVDANVIASGTTTPPIPVMDGTTRSFQAGTLPAECAPGAQGAAAVTGATIDWVAYNPDRASTTGVDGVNGVVMALTVAGIPAGGTATVTYSAHMRSEYSPGNETSATDRITNDVILNATTTSVLDGTEATVADDSSVTLTSLPSQISKKVLPRTVPFAGGVNPCDVDSSLYTTDPTLTGGFAIGDQVCYELTVNFNASADARNPQVVDMLPTWVDVANNDWVATLAAPIATTETVDVERTNGRLTFTPHTAGDPASGDWFVERGSTLTIHIWGTVNGLSADSGSLDKPQNLMKFTQSNVHGDISFDRQAAAIEVLSGLELVKGIADVNNAVVSGAASCDGSRPDCDDVQVKETDVITYRVDVGGGLDATGAMTGSPVDVRNLTVWDVLPASFTNAWIASVSHGGSVYRPADSGRPTGVPADRTVIVWNNVGVNVGLTDTLTYDLTVPDGTAIASSHDNTAGIVSYRVQPNTGGTTELLFPENPYGSAAVPTDGIVIPAAGTIDDSSVNLRNAGIAKRVVSTEVGVAQDANNNGTGTQYSGTTPTTPWPQAVAGEWITWEYSLTVPARTTIPAGSVLRDQGNLSTSSNMTAPRAYTVQPGSAVASSTDPAAVAHYSLNATNGALTFDTAYDNQTNEDQVISVQITALTNGTGFSHGSNLYNRASFTNGATTATLDTNARAQFLVPNPELAKAVNTSDPVRANQTLTYTLTVTNPQGTPSAPNRPTAFDTIVTDCVPAELTTVTPVGSPAGVTVTPADCGDGNTGTRITWDAGDVPMGETRTLQYTVVVSPAAAGGASYTNPASLTSHTLDGSPADRGVVTNRDTSETVTVEGAGVVKTSTPGSGAIGDTIDYEIEVTLPAEVNFYNVHLIDAVPEGIRVDASTVTVTSADAAVEAAFANRQVTAGGGGDIRLQATAAAPGHLISAPTARTMTVAYTGTIVTHAGTTPDRGDALTNTATLRWTIAESPTSGERSIGDSETVTVLEPTLTIAKLVEGVDSTFAGPETEVDYAITVTNPGGTNVSTAHDVRITDVVPEGLHTVTPAASLPLGVSVVSNTVDPVTGETTVVWLIDAIEPNTAVTLPYTATLADSADLDGSTLRNVASITEYFSHPTNTDDRRRYTGPNADADVTPAFPDVVVAKTAPGGIEARVGEPFTWQVTIRNQGYGAAATVQAVDTLPAGWGTAVVTQVTRDGVVVPQADWGFDVNDLTWDFTDVKPRTNAPVYPGEVIVVTYTAIPTTAAYTAPAAGVGPLPLGSDTVYAHVNTVGITATDATGATSNADRDYAGPDADANAFLRATDVQITKERLGTDTVYAGDEVSWRVTVTNNGPQQANGISVTDALPAGLTFTGVATPTANATTGWGFSITGDTLTATLATLANGASASFEVTTRTLAAAVPTATNAVTVTSTTPDTDPSNNDDDDEVPVVASADLWTLKSALPGDVIAGATVDWQIRVGNNGLSSADGPITVVDTMPVGVVAVVAGPGHDASWTVSAYDTTTRQVTLTRATALAAGAEAPIIVLRSTLASDLVAGTLLENHAVVSSPTHDPVPSNDESTGTTTGSGSEVNLSIAKSLVGGGTLSGGETERYRLEITNDGPSTAADVVVVDDLPNGLVYAGAVTSLGSTWNWVSTSVDGDPTFALTGGLAPNTTTWLEFDVDVDPSIVAIAGVAGTVTNTATVSTSTPEDDLSDNTDTEVSPVEAISDLMLVKSYTGSTGRVGSTVDFTIEVTNFGPATAQQVTVVDTLPTGLTFTGVTDPAVGAGWTFSITGDTLTATLDTDLVPVAGGATVSFTVTALVLPAAYPSVTNAAVVTTTTPEVDDPTHPNTDEAIVPVDPQSSLSIEKLAGSPRFQVGEQAEYTITVTNHGPTEHPGGYAVTDVLPVELSAVSVDHADCAITPAGATDGGTLDCVITAPLGVGDSLTITLTVDVLAAAWPQVENTAEVTTTVEDPDPTDNTSTVITPVDPDVRFALSKERAAVDGSTVTWTLTVESIGLNDAVDGVRVIDVLPDELTLVSITPDAAAVGAAVTCDAVAQLISCEHPGVLASGESFAVSIVTTTSQAAGTTVTNTAWLEDPVTGDRIPDSEATADHDVPPVFAVTGGTVPTVALLGALFAVLVGVGLVVVARQRNRGEPA